MNTRVSERGQAIVLIILAIVGIFGFGALAVDMGQVYAERRSAQSAADSAALAAAYDSIAGSKDTAKAIDQAYAMANTNGFNNDGETNWVEVNNPPIGGPYCGICGQPGAEEYYQVKITARTSPIFAQLIFGGAEQISVEAIAHAKGPDSVSTGDAIHALDNGDKALIFDGNTAVYVDGGNIRSNGSLYKKGNSGGVSVTDGGIYYAGETKGDVPLSPSPVKEPGVGAGSILPPSCPTAAERASWPSENGYKYKNFDGVDYFYYPSGLSVETLPPGIHCVDGGIGKGNYTGNDILIVLLSGGVSQEGNDSVDFRAATDLKDRNGNQWGGMVLYAPKTNTNVLKFVGNSGAYFQGVVYAPAAECEFGGTEDGVAQHTAFVCNTIKINGNPHLNITYRPAELYHFPPIVELVQ